MLVFTNLEREIRPRGVCTYGARGQIDVVDLVVHGDTVKGYVQRVGTAGGRGSRKPEHVNPVCLCVYHLIYVRSGTHGSQIGSTTAWLGSMAAGNGRTRTQYIQTGRCPP